MHNYITVLNERLDDQVSLGSKFLTYLNQRKSLQSDLQKAPPRSGIDKLFK